MKMNTYDIKPENTEKYIMRKCQAIWKKRLGMRYY